MEGGGRRMREEGREGRMERGGEKEGKNKEKEERRKGEG